MLALFVSYEDIVLQQMDVIKYNIHSNHCKIEFPKLSPVIQHIHHLKLIMTMVSILPTRMISAPWEQTIAQCPFPITVNYSFLHMSIIPQLSFNINLHERGIYMTQLIYRHNIGLWKKIRACGGNLFCHKGTCKLCTDST